MPPQQASTCSCGTRLSPSAHDSLILSVVHQNKKKCIDIARMYNWTLSTHVSRECYLGREIPQIKLKGLKGPNPKRGPRGLRGMARSHGPSLQYNSTAQHSTAQHSTAQQQHTGNTTQLFYIQFYPKFLSIISNFITFVSGFLSTLSQQYHKISRFYPYKYP